MIKLKHILLESNIDKLYLDVISRNDLVAAQKMVDYVAKKQGYLIKAFHGSPNTFYIFDPARGGERTNAKSAKLGFFSSSARDVAVQYKRTQRELSTADWLGPLSYTTQTAQDNLERFVDNATTKIEFDANEQGYIAYITTIDTWGNKYTYQADKYVYDSKEEAEEAAEIAYEKELEILKNELEKREKNRDEMAKKLDTERTLHSLYLKIQNPLIYNFRGGSYLDKSFSELIQTAIDEKRDGVILQNVNDAIDDNKISDVYIFFKSSQAKLSDPIVYNSNKQIIPLSQRFNQKNNDIRYQ